MLQVEENEWVHIAVTYDAANDYISYEKYKALSIFIDGKKSNYEKVGASTERFPNREPLYIGGRNADILTCPNCPDAFFMGMMDDVRIFSRALTFKEIESEKDRHIHNPTAPASLRIVT
jgi:hypothetical protein